VDIKPLSIAGAWSVSPKVHGDDRGSFAEWFRGDQLEDITGFRFSPVQGNISRSAKGVVRGIHYADVPPGQAKYVMPVSGSIIDFVVDIRVGSPTFGQWDSVTLHSESRDAVLIEPGLGHAFVALNDDTVVTYLVTDVFRPDREHGINPLDPAIGLIFPAGINPVLSNKDTAAPMLAEAHAASALPAWSKP
jgi:dTDP-4-dehydrorhamnose 3,5-epimerase